jgi:hypothetical protein
MNEAFDREKVIDCMFDPITSSILSELEDGPKQCSFLAKQFSIPESDVLERLSYLIKFDFVLNSSETDDCLVSANFEKLSTIVEEGENFDEAISGLEKMDSYLN